MAEKNPLLPTGLKSADNSISSAGSERHMLQANHPPAEIVSYTSPINSINHSPQRQKQDTYGNNSSRNRGDTRNRIAIPRSPQSSRSRTDKIASYNLEYRGKIPEASKFFFLFLIFGMVLVVIAAVASGWLTLNKTKNHSDISNIILPLVIYVMNIVECSLFYLEARTFQMRGYTQLFQDASKSSKINFRLISCYYVVSLSIYGFLMHHTDSHFPDTKSRDRIFLGIWYFAYGIIIIFLFNFGKRFWIHNRDKPKPDLFFPHPNNNNYIQNSPLHRGGNKSDLGIPNMQIISDDQTEVVQKLQRDKQTLMRQLESMKKKYERTLSELEQLQADNTSSILGGGGSNIGSIVAINSGNNIAINNETIELKKQIQKLRSKLRNEREQIKSVSTSLETKTTMLDAQKAETQQLRNVLQQKDDRIQQLMNDKESLERGINACNDKLDDWQLLYQVKEQEVEIAKKENDRLRKKLQQITMQTNNY